MRASQKRSASLSTVVWCRASPQNRKSLRLGMGEDEKLGSARQRSSNEGVETHTSMPESARLSNSARKSSDCSAVTA